MENWTDREKEKGKSSRSDVSQRYECLAVYHHYQRAITIVTTLPSPYHHHSHAIATTATSTPPPLPQSPFLSPLHHHYTRLHDTGRPSPHLPQSLVSHFSGIEWPVSWHQGEHCLHPHQLIAETQQHDGREKHVVQGHLIRVSPSLSPHPCKLDVRPQDRQGDMKDVRTKD